MTNVNLARRASKSSASPYKTDLYVDVPEEEKGKKTGDLTIGECLRLAKVLSDHSALPASCQRYIDEQTRLQKAYDGAGGNMAARAAVAKQSSRTGGMNHAQLQRRWTSRRDPLKK